MEGGECLKVFWGGGKLITFGDAKTSVQMFCLHLFVCWRGHFEEMIFFYIPHPFLHQNTFLPIFFPYSKRACLHENIKCCDRFYGTESKLEILYSNFPSLVKRVHFLSLANLVGDFPIQLMAASDVLCLSDVQWKYLTKIKAG